MKDNESMRGMAQTVLGPVKATDLGITLPHEHLLSDFSCIFKEPTEISRKRLAHEAITLSNRGWVNYHWTDNLDNVRLWDEEVAVKELANFTAAGGKTIADPTNIGIGRDPLGLARVARMTGVNIIMGAGHYLHVAHPPDVAERSEASIAEEIVSDITSGVGETGIKAGFIGEIGCTHPLARDERKCLVAAVEAQKATGAALMVHPGRDRQSPLDILDIVQKEGGNLGRTIICHIERTCRDQGWLKEIAGSGCFLEYDLFGNESSYYPPNPAVDMPSDAQRMDLLTWHFDQGHGARLLVSHDIATKNRLQSFGGLGYDHLITNIMPRMRERGFSAQQIDSLMVANPANSFCFF